jgi:hypothetical protein
VLFNFEIQAKPFTLTVSVPISGRKIEGECDTAGVQDSLRAVDGRLGLSQ